MEEMQVRSLGGKDPLQKEVVTHSSILAWRIPWTEELGGATVLGVTKSWTQGEFAESKGYGFCQSVSSVAQSCPTLRPRKE